MILGPEFHRNIWLRFSLFSILLMPVLIGCGLLLSYLSFLVHDNARVLARLTDSSYMALYKADPHWSYRSLFLSFPLLFITLYVLSIYEAASSFTNELRNKTWDIQKISAIRPIHLVLGKIFGVTSYSWYFSFGILATILYAYSNMFEDVTAKYLMGPINPTLIYPSWLDILSLAGIIIFSAFTGQLVAALASLKNLSNKSMGSFMPLIYGLSSSFFCFALLMSSSNIMFWGKIDKYVEKDPVQWFFYEVPHKLMLFLVVLFFVFWGCIAIHRMARRELNFQSYPFIWLLFLSSLSIYLTGFNYKIPNDFFEILSDHKSVSTLYVYTAIIFFFATYSSLYYESNRVSNYLRFYRSINGRQYKRMLETVPAWFFTLVITCIVLFLSIIHFDDNGETNWNFVSLLASLVLFMIRDGIAMHICLLSDYFKRGGLMIAVYYVFVYVIMPILAFKVIALLPDVGDIKQNIFKSEYKYGYVIGMFSPSPQDSLSRSLLPVISEIFVFTYVLWMVTAVYRRR